MNTSSNERSAHDLVSPNLARYLGGASRQKRPGRIIQQRSSNEQQQQRAINVINGHQAGSNNLNHRTAINHNKNEQRKKTATKKKPIAKKNLVIMYPSKQLTDTDKTPDKSLNMTQLLFSPGATDSQGMVHSIFSPPATNVKMLRDVGTDIDDFVFSPISHAGSIGQCADRSYARGMNANNEVSLLADHITFADHSCENEPQAGVDITISDGPEKENVAPMKQLPEITRSNPKTPAKTPSMNVDDSSIDSLGEFYTPCPKTPGTKSSSKYNRMEDEISYESLNTTRESKEYLLSTFGNEETRESWEKEDRWEEHDEEESSEEEMVFVTPKHRADKRSNGSGSSGEDQFFSPLAHYPNDTDEGSSVNLMMEAKSLLAAAKTQQSLSVIQDESGDDEFFSPLAHHVSSNRVTRPMPYEESGFDQFSPIPANNNAREVEEEPVEEGSTYRLINDVKSILAARKPVASRENTPVLDLAASQPDTRDQSQEQPTDSIRANSQMEYSFSEKSDSPFDFQLTPTPEAAQAQLTSNEYSPSFPDTTSPKTQESNVTPHLHSPSLSALPAGALTVDFIRNCDSVETLKTILMVLNSSKRGKQLRQPRLVQFVHMRLSKLGYSDDAASRQSTEENNDDANLQEESHWQHFQRESEWNVKLPPRIVGGRRGGKCIAWSEDVKDNKSVASVSLQSSLSFESIIQDKYDMSIINDATGSNTILNTPKVVQITDMPMPTSSPSIHLSYSVAESSLDMNLSESFTLGDESAYWKMNVDNIPEEEEDDAMVHNITLSQREVELSRELEEIREAYEDAKADVKRLTAIVKSIEKNEVSPKDKRADDRLEREVEAARLANRALANTLAVSEKDLANAIESRDTKAKECEKVMAQLKETGDENAFLSSRVKELEKELESCNSYIDSLYSELNEKSSPSYELHAELEKREEEWLELENRYNATIEQLQAELNAQSKKVSMEMYLAVMKESRRHKIDSAEKQLKIDELTSMVEDLRDEIERIKRSPPKPALKSISSLHNKVRPRQVSPTYQQHSSFGDAASKENLEPATIKNRNENSSKSARVTIAAIKSSLEARKGLRARRVANTNESRD